MLLTHLALENFRLFVHFARALPRGPLLIVGPNAQGKTSLLEAVAYLATFSSALTRADKEIIHFLALREPLSVARIRATCQRGPMDEVRLEVRIIHQVRASNHNQTRKEVLVNGVRRKLVDALGLCTAVLFLPQMLRWVDGAPELRRRFLNQSLAQVDPAYARALLEYNRALAQRNALLKAVQEGRARADDLAVWDQTLALLAARLMRARAQAVEDWNRLLTARHHDLLYRTEPLRLVYRPALDVPEAPAQVRLFGGAEAPEPPAELLADETALAEHLLQRLTQRREHDIRRGNTGLGPQRDDLRFVAGGLDLAAYGSRGQVRTALLLLKLAEAAWYTERTGHKPLLLLDDLLAELDATRREDILRHFFAAGDQVLLTATDEAAYPAAYRERTEVWRLQAGQVVEVQPAARA
ncbi:MAG: DNA replication/repair protein RecF [Chloroflexi bacterium]|nr:DNA replication/repair protein RecF [Chloroflexota bacterium]